MSLSEDIFAVYDTSKIPPKAVHAFGRDLFVRKWSGRTRAIWEALVFDREGKEKPEARREAFVAATVVCSLIDQDCRPVFVALGHDDEVLMDFSAVVDAYSAVVRRACDLDFGELEKVFTVASKLNGLDKDTVGDAEKNSGDPPSLPSPSS